MISVVNIKKSYFYRVEIQCQFSSLRKQVLKRIGELNKCFKWVKEAFLFNMQLFKVWLCQQ